MRPRSGFRSPRASFRIVLLPEPATPNKALVSPRGKRKEMPSSTTCSSKAMATSSKTMTSWEGSSRATSRIAAGSVGVAMRLRSQHSHQEAGHEHVDRDDQDHGCHHGFGGGAAHALGPALGGESVIAAHSRHDKSEDDRLRQPHEYIGEHQRLPGVAPVFMRIHAEQDAGHDA